MHPSARQVPQISFCMLLRCVDSTSEFRLSRVDLNKFSAFWLSTSSMKSLFMRSSSNPLTLFPSLPLCLSLSSARSLCLWMHCSLCVFLQWRHSFRMAPVSSMLADSCGATQLKEGLWCHQQGRGPSAWTNWIKWARERWPGAVPNLPPHSYTVFLFFINICTFLFDVRYSAHMQTQCIYADQIHAFRLLKKKKSVSGNTKNTTISYFLQTFDN